jgi:hypothetical protein
MSQTGRVPSRALPPRKDGRSLGDDGGCKIPFPVSMTNLMRCRWSPVYRREISPTRRARRDPRQTPQRSSKRCAKQSWRCGGRCRVVRRSRQSKKKKTEVFRLSSTKKNSPPTKKQRKTAVNQPPCFAVASPQDPLTSQQGCSPEPQSVSDAERQKSREENNRHEIKLRCAAKRKTR